MDTRRFPAAAERPAGHPAPPRLRVVPAPPPAAQAAPGRQPRQLSNATAAAISTYRRLLAPAPPPAGPVGEAAPTCVPPRPWMRYCQDVHSALPHPKVVGVDAAVLLGVATLALRLAPPSAAVLVVSTLVVALAAGVYADRDTVQTQGVLWYPVRTLLPAAVAALVALSLHRLPAALLLPAVGFEVAGLTLVRLSTWLLLSALRRHGRAMLPTLLLGRPDEVDAVAGKLLQFPEAGLAPVSAARLEEVLLGDGLCEAVRQSGAQHVVLIPEASADLAVAATLRRFAALPASFSMVPPLPDLFLSSAQVAEVGGMPLIPLGRLLRGRTTFPGKRLIDVVVSLSVLLLVAPVLLVAALAVKLEDGGPVLYRQRRVGRGGQPFQMLKLRSMVVDADQQVAALQDANAVNGNLFKVQDDPRVTRVGRLLRRLSVDELPQLVNVLRGQMSLVGPRPLPVDPDDFGSLENERHTVLPGITGYWQISGGTGLTYEEMVKLDLAYVHNWSMWLDVRLMLRTLPALMYRRGPC